MNGSKRKYLSEFAVNLVSGRWLMTTAAQLSAGNKIVDSEMQEVADRCHIYLIYKTPSLSFKKETFSYEGGVVSGHVAYRVGGDERNIPFSRELNLVDGATQVKLSDYPHREMRLLNSDGDQLRYFPANMIVMGGGLHLNNPDLSDLEVLYVGQSYGDGSRSAFERLKSHSKLQEILAAAQYESPDSEIGILAFEYAPYRVLTNFDGLTGAQITDQRDEVRFYSIHENPLSEHQQICLAEAGLIRYFQPKYNEIYKEKFPSQKHKILEECYKLDFSGLVVEINTEELGLALFSEAVSANDHHMCIIDLISHEDRWGFFHFPSGDEAKRMPGVITGS